MCAIPRARCCACFATRRPRSATWRSASSTSSGRWTIWPRERLQRKLELVGRISRGEFDALLDAMTRAGLIDIEEAEFEKNGEVIRFRKIRLTEDGLAVRRVHAAAAAHQRWNWRGICAAGRAAPRRRRRRSRNLRKSRAPADSGPVLSPAQDKLAALLKQWRAAEAKRLGVPAYVVLHDRTVTALAVARPENPRQLLEIDGMGPAKAEKFGEAILKICREAQ